jgi:hypothetical protein
VEVSITSEYQAHQTYVQHTVMLILTCIALCQILYRLITKGSLQREAEMSRSVISVWDTTHHHVSPSHPRNIG